MFWFESNRQIGVLSLGGLVLGEDVNFEVALLFGLVRAVWTLELTVHAAFVACVLVQPTAVLVALATTLTRVQCCAFKLKHAQSCQSCNHNTETFNHNSLQLIMDDKGFCLYNQCQGDCFCILTTQIKPTPVSSIMMNPSLF